jgi:hypothetical protein
MTFPYGCNRQGFCLSILSVAEMASTSPLPLSQGPEVNR